MNISSSPSLLLVNPALLLQRCRFDRHGNRSFISPLHVCTWLFHPSSRVATELQTGQRTTVASCCRTQETHKTQTQQIRIPEAEGRVFENHRKAGKHNLKCRITPCCVTMLSRLQPPPQPSSFPLSF